MDRQIIAPLRIHAARLSVAHWAMLALLALGAVAIWATNVLLTERFTDSTRTRAELRLALFTGNIVTELQRNAVVPLLLAQDPILIDALASGDTSRSARRLNVLLDEVGAAGFLLLDADGRTVSATDGAALGRSHADAPYFQQALRAPDTVFTHHQRADGAMVFAYARRVAVPGQSDGVVVVLVDLAKFERAWAGLSEAVLVTDSRGTVLLATEPAWRGTPEVEALATVPAEDAVSRSQRAGTPLPVLGTDAQPVLRSDARLPFQGWRIASFTPFQTVRDRVNGVLAFEAALLATALTAGFYITSRQARARSVRLQKDADDLRALNARLGQEIAERKRAEANLQVAEQTLEQSSKLAALGEMSAAISHELNQPLAAMKTYLAGARLLVQRDCTEEALASFRRIDDLIVRMGKITRQLKSHARRGGDAAARVDMRDVITAALSIMEPQLKTQSLRINIAVPDDPVMVLVDPLRLEQVLINLLRNAMDATRASPAPRIEVILTAGDTATVTVRDNGHGIADLDTLFEPFYTTKPPGDGVGLGLAIASGIVAEFDGALTARNAAAGGAVFEMQLPIAVQDRGADLPPPADRQAGG